MNANLSTEAKCGARDDAAGPKGYGRQPGQGKSNAENEEVELAFSYTEAGSEAGAGTPPRSSDFVVESRIKPYAEQQAEKARRVEQQRVYRRNQVIGLVMLAAAICAWWLWHTNPKWIAPPGWWRW